MRPTLRALPLLLLALASGACSLGALVAPRAEATAAPRRAAGLTAPATPAPVERCGFDSKYVSGSDASGRYVRMVMDAHGYFWLDTRTCAVLTWNDQQASSARDER